MNGITAYKENSVTTQSRGMLVVLLYEGAIKFLNQAIVELEAGRFVEKGQYINKAIDIINELDVSLNMEIKGGVAENLRKLYLFMIAHLNKANFQRDPQMVRQVIGMLDDLVSAWKAISQ